MDWKWFWIVILIIYAIINRIQLMQFVNATNANTVVMRENIKRIEREFSSQAMDIEGLNEDMRVHIKDTHLKRR